MEFYIGTILWDAFNYAPEDFLICDGTAYPITQYQPLFSLIGYSYGGNGQSTFAVPNLLGRTVFGPPEKNYPIGLTGGQASYALYPSLLQHTHNATATAQTPPVGVSLSAQTSVPDASLVSTPQTGYTLAITTDATMGATPQIYAPPRTGTGNVSLGGVAVIAGNPSVSVTVAPAGSMTGPVNIPTLPPDITLLPIIAYNGVYPVRP